MAARFDTTPSELTLLNRLSTSFIYPGQQLLVPDKKARQSISEGVAADASNDQTSSEYGRQDSGQGGVAESGASGKSSPVARKLSAAKDHTNEGEEGESNGSCGMKHIHNIMT